MTHDSPLEPSRPLRPPRLAAALLDWLLPTTTAAESIRGDAWEEFVQRCDTRSASAAARWYWMHVMRLSLGYALPAITRELGEVGMGLGVEWKRVVRGLKRTPGSSATAVLVLGMGIGLTAFMFSIIVGMAFRGFGLPDEDRLRVVEVLSQQNSLVSGFPEVHLVQSVFDGIEGAEVGGFEVTSANLTVDGRPIRLSAAFLTPNGFEILGVEPAMGRAPSVAEASNAAEVPIVISHRTWTDELGSRDDVVGLEVWSDGEPMTVVGVMPEGFGFPQTEDAWIPLDTRYELGESRQGRVTAILRMHPDTDVEQLDQALAARAIGAREADPTLPRDLTYRSTSLTMRYTGSTMINVLMAMAVAVGMVLLVACANVANLLSSRASQRAGEVGLAVAIGGSRTRVILPFFLEALVLALAGAALGVLVAYWGLGVIDAATSMERTGRPYFIQFMIDGPVLAFTVAIAFVTALVAGASPALKAARVSPSLVMKSQVAGDTAQVGRLNQALVVAEIALSTAVLIGTVGTVQSLVNLSRVDLGFDSTPIMTSRVALMGERYATGEARQDFARRYLDRLRARDDLSAVALADNLPAMGAVDPLLDVEGRSWPRDEDRPRGSVMSISPGFFNVLGEAVVEGRDFTDDDAIGAPVALIDEPLAELIFPGGGALESRIRVFDEEGSGTWHRIVGIVPDVTPQGLDPDADPGGLYLPLMSRGGSFVSALVRRAGGEPEGAVPAMRAALAETDPDQPMYLVEALPGRIDEGIWFYRTFGSLFLYFGVAALAMAGLGLYAILSSSVTRRRREFGVRIALGADTSRVVRAVSRAASTQVGIGLALGLTFGWLAAGMIQILAFEVDPRDPSIFAGVALVVLGVSALATLSPTLRALRISPVQALREE